MQDIDIKQVGIDVLDKTKIGLLEIAVGASKEVIEAINFYIGDAEERFANLFRHVAEGGDAKFFIEMMGREKNLLKSIMLSFVVITKGIAQTVVNSLYDILLDSITLVLTQFDKKKDE